MIVRQQEQAKWGDAVVHQLAADLRSAFPDLKGLSRDNLFRMRQFFLACREIDQWLAAESAQPTENQALAARGEEVGALARQSGAVSFDSQKVGTVSRQLGQSCGDVEFVGTRCRLLKSVELSDLILGLSWSHHRTILGSCESPAERHFYMAMSARERWSVRELRRQIDSDLVTRYVSREPDMTCRM